MRIATMGAAISGNKGAASMIEALTERFRGEATIIVLTTYPDEDRKLADASSEVVRLTPVSLLVVDLPLALIGRAFPRTLRRRVHGWSPGLRALASADVVADISGVSFSDHRGPKFHAYNAILTMLPMLVGTPTVKCAQAMGPFEQRSNRVIAKRLLPRIDRVLARGERSHQFLVDLGVPIAVERAADLAFTLSHDAPLQHSCQTTLARLGGRPVLMVMPSAVVEAWCERHRIDHAGLFAEIIETACRDLGVGVALVPHAFRASGTPRRMDDARVCRTIAQRLGARADVVVIDEDLAPAQLRALVGRADALVASRFHGMVTGLASSTPTVVIGWGHKYAEVLAEFGAEEFALDYSALRTPADVSALITSVWERRHAISEQFRTAGVEVRRAADVNFQVLTELGARR